MAVFGRGGGLRLTGLKQRGGLAHLGCARAGVFSALLGSEGGAVSAHLDSAVLLGWEAGGLAAPRLGSAAGGRRF